MRGDDWNPCMPTWERLLIWCMFAWAAVGVLALRAGAPDPVERPVPPTVVTAVPSG